jgi:hypothetical protein
MNKSMMLITSTWGSNAQKTFKLIPVTDDCPYNEGIYDADSKVLALISKEKKESMHMLPKLNEWGDLTPMKIGKRPNGKDYAEERKTLETFYEYYVENVEEVKYLLNSLAINSDSFDYAVYLDAAPKSKIEAAPSLIQTV